MPSARRVLPALLATSLLLAPLSVAAAPNATSFKGGAFERTVSVSITNLPLREAIRLVAQKGRINLVIEDNLPETVNVEFKDVRLGDALQSLFDIGGLQAYWKGDVFSVISRKKAFERGMLASNARIFELKYANSARVAEFLNSTALTTPYTGLTTTTSGTQNQQRLEIAKADPHTNTVLVMGSSSDIAVAERVVEALDRPQAHRIFKLSHATAVHVASILNSSVFNNGNKATETTPLRVDVENLAEGSGAVSTSSGVELTTQATNLRNRTLQTETIPVEAKQSVAIPDSRTNSVIVMGSAETLAIAEQIIPTLDRKLQQVAIDVEILEISHQDALDMGVSFGGQQNSVISTFDPTATTNPGWAVSYDSSTFFPQAFRARLNAMVKDQKAKVLARPTILASDNTESQINIVDEVIKGTRISNQGLNLGNGQTLVVVEPIYGVAGVSLNILPKIGADGTVTLRLHPTVSTVRETQRDSMGNPLSLLSRRELLAQQVTVESGKTLSLAGLTQNTRITARRKFPILGDIPFLGALFRSTSNEDRQTELVILMTPRILE